MPILGVISLKDLIDGVRENLAAWPFIAILSPTINATATSIVLASGIAPDYIGVKSLLEIDDEVMFVTEVTDPTTFVVMRGYQGTTAVAHLNNAKVRIHPFWSWTDRVIRFDFLPKAIRWLKPFAWMQGVSETFDWPSGSYSVQTPTSALIDNPHGNLIIKMERLLSSGDFIPFYNWELAGSFLRFGQRASTLNRIHAIMAVFQPKLQDLDDTLDNDDFEECIVQYAASLALNSLKTNRVRFLGYSGALDDRASTPDELIRVAFDLKNAAILSREEHMRPMPPTYVKTYRDPR